MKLSSTVICAVFALGANAAPTRHAALAAPVAFANIPDAAGQQLQPQLQPVVQAPLAVDPRADRDARREERRKEWQEWARQQDENGVSNGSNFIGQILSGVSGIVESALGPVYTLMGQ
ncbi:hypothetical protein IWW38_000360 [Coemansia aciculifera]|uniref:Uncharacterized protein n=1 Tax=Coemansia aciculifera TaxID=417176 RepID=A0ACC1MB41_9FUNG|nr:hypothetical protein IWW38_000360 [Coemansia aciculifera]